MNGVVGSVSRNTSLPLAVPLAQVGAPGCVNSKPKSSPPLGFTFVAVRMPGLLPGPTAPAPEIAPTRPEPPSVAPASSDTPLDDAIVPFTTSAPACTHVPPE